MKQHWTQKELQEEWTLSSKELAFINSKGKESDLHFALKFKFYEHYGYIPNLNRELAEYIVNHIAKQVGCNAESWVSSTLSNRLSRNHNIEIRKYFGFRAIGEKDINELRLWLYEHHFPFNPTYEQLSAAAYKHLYNLKIEPCSNAQMTRYLKSWGNQFEVEFFNKGINALSSNDKDLLDQLVAEGDKIMLNDLKQDPGKASVKAINIEIEKLEYVKKITILSSKYFSKLSPNLVKKYHDYVISTVPSELQAYTKHKSDKKYALLASFCYVRGVRFTDNLIDILIRLTRKIARKAKKKVKAEFWDNRRAIYNKDKVLTDMATVSIENPKGVIEEKIFPKVGKETLEEIVKKPISFDEYNRQRKYHYMRLSYIKHYRRMLSPIFNNLVFCSNNEKNKPLLKAISIIKKYMDSNLVYYPEDEDIPQNKVLPNGCLKLIVEKTGTTTRVNRINYELVVLRVLCARLRCKDIWVEGAEKYRNPDEDLPQDFEENKEEYYQAINKPLDVARFIGKLKEELALWLTTLNKSMPRNKKVKIIKRKSKAWIKVSPVKAQPDPKNINNLKQEILARWPGTGLLDILKEIELRLDLTSGFESVASKEIISREDLQYRILLCLFALATNTGLKRISANVPGVTYEDLRYIQRRFINKDSIRNAIIKVINGNLEIRDKKLFGDITISCASDSRKFSAWDQNLMTEWHVRYAGSGVMVYWHVDKKSLCVYSQLKTCSSSEIAAMIEGVIHHATNAKIAKNYVDSHGQSLVAFAFAYLLNFDLLPRLKAIGAEKLYIPATDFSAKDNIEDILTRAINWHIIEECYNQMIQYATALRLKTAAPEALLKRFTANNLQHPVYQALQELGRVIKTIFLCKYLHSKELRQEIHDGLNVIERWNSVNDFIFYGKKSVVSTNEITNQELAILSLHLLQASLVYINTLMIQKVLSSPGWQNKLTIEDKRALTPLIYLHVNPYGIFKLNMRKRIKI